MKTGRPLILALSLLAASPAPAAEPGRAAWRADLDQLEAALEASYANLAWMASPESGANLPAADRRARAALDAATSEDEARAALRAFAASFRDGHFSELPTLSPASATPEPEPETAALDPADPSGGCAALGFAATAPIAFSLPFESLPGFKLAGDGLSTPFRAGEIVAPDGRKIGVVRIQNFRPVPFPDVCRRAWAELAATGRPVTVRNLRTGIRDAWLSALAEQLRQFRTDGAQGVIVDVGGNSGGNDSGDWMARLFTDRPVVSARLLMVAGPQASTYLDEETEALDEALKAASAPEAKIALRRALDTVSASRKALAKPACDLSWVWREQRPWRLEACNRLVGTGFAGGQLSDAPAGTFTDRAAAEVLSSVTTVDRWRGAWTGPVYVLTNGKTYSSAEMFAAVMRDNGVAKTIGDRTGGAGCGFMTDEAPLTLTSTRLRFRMPDCARLRADGTDEVAGVQPDLPLPSREGESERARAMRALRAVSVDLAAAPPSLAAGRAPPAARR